MNRLEASYLVDEPIRSQLRVFAQAAAVHPTAQPAQPRPECAVCLFSFQVQIKSALSLNQIISAVRIKRGCSETGEFKTRSKLRLPHRLETNCKCVCKMRRLIPQPSLECCSVWLATLGVDSGADVASLERVTGACMRAGTLDNRRSCRKRQTHGSVQSRTGLSRSDDHSRLVPVVASRNSSANCL